MVIENDAAEVVARIDGDEVVAERGEDPALVDHVVETEMMTEGKERESEGPEVAVMTVVIGKSYLGMSPSLLKNETGVLCSVCSWHVISDHGIWKNFSLKLDRCETSGSFLIETQGVPRESLMLSSQMHRQCLSQLR